MQNIASRSLIDRMIGVARLDVPTFESIEHDLNATPSAMLVVIVVAICGGIGSLREDGFGGLIGGIIGALIGWAVFAAFVYFVGTRLLAGPETSSSWGEVARTTGFAQTPNVLLIFGFIPILGGIIAIIASIWTLIAQIVGIRQALDISTGRAIAVGIVAIIAEVIVMAIIAAILGVTIYGVGSI